ncbi:prepilin peptidase [Vibrio comitans]|uniref:prepilin peptidase n=1 Tax=Vibrio comitans TaxID=413401 RepID=UPI0011421140
MFLILYSVVSLTVIYTDVKYRKIYNIQCILIFLLSYFISTPWMTNKAVLLSILMLSFISIVIYKFRVWAGGDSKLLIAISPLFMISLLPYVIYLILLCGGIISIFYWVKYRLVFRSRKDRGLPYGLAIISGSNIFLYGILYSVAIYN